MEAMMKRDAGVGAEVEERPRSIGPARRSLQRWARPSPYTPSPRRFAASILPSRFSQPSQRENEQRAAPRTEGNQIVNVDPEISEIEKHIKSKIFTREESDHIMEVLRSRTPSLRNNDTFSTKAPQFPNNSESTQTRSLTNTTAWRPGDSVYSKPNANGSTPIEMAKAYMKSLNSPTPNKDQSQTRRFSFTRNQFENSGSKPSIHWPGAVLPDKNIYQSPPSNEGNNNVLMNSPRVPTYPHSRFSRSTFKVKNDRDSYDVFSSEKKRRLIPFEGSKKPNAIFREESESTPKRSSFERREYSLNESVPVHSRKSNETAEKILKCLDGPISTPFRKTLIQDKINREKEDEKEKLNRKMESGSVSFGNQKQEIRSFKFPEASKDSEPKSASKPALNPPEIGGSVFMDTGGSVFGNAGGSIFANPGGSSTAGNTPITRNKAAETGGSSFSFPIPNNKFHEPPPTPTMPTSPSLTVPTVPAVPTFKFGSSNSTSPLVFSFGSNTNDVSTFGDESLPVFKFGSDQNQDLKFSFGSNDALCC